MYKIGDRVIFHQKKNAPKATVIGVKKINLSSIPLYSIEIRYDFTYKGYETFEFEISGNATGQEPEKNKLERNCRKIKVCTNCNVEENLIENSDGDLITNLIEVCISRQDDDYDFFCNKCLGFE